MYLVLKVSIFWPFGTLSLMHFFFLDCRQTNEGWLIKIASKCSWTAYLWEATNSSSSLELQTMIHSSSLFVTSTREIIRCSTVMHVSSLKICQPSIPNKHKITLYPYHSISACAIRKTGISFLISGCIRILQLVAYLLLQNGMLFIFWQLWFTLQLKQQLPG